jgi:hypothetical protein
MQAGYPNEEEAEEAARFGFSKSDVVFSLSSCTTASIHRYLRFHRAGALRDVKRNGYSILVEGTEDPFTAKRNVDALLLLASFASRQRTLAACGTPGNSALKYLSAAFGERIRFVGVGRRPERIHVESECVELFVAIAADDLVRIRQGRAVGNEPSIARHIIPALVECSTHGSFLIRVPNRRHPIARSASWTNYRLRSKFGIKLVVLPIPSGADFRVRLSSEDQAQVSREIDANVAHAFRRWIGVHLGSSTPDEAFDGGAYR